MSSETRYLSFMPKYIVDNKNLINTADLSGTKFDIIYKFVYYTPDCTIIIDIYDNFFVVDENGIRKVETNLKGNIIGIYNDMVAVEYNLEILMYSFLENGDLKFRYNFDKGNRNFQDIIYIDQIGIYLKQNYILGKDKEIIPRKKFKVDKEFMYFGKIGYISHVLAFMEDNYFDFDSIQYQKYYINGCYDDFYILYNYISKKYVKKDAKTFNKDSYYAEIGYKLFTRYPSYPSYYTINDSEINYQSDYNCRYLCYHLETRSIQAMPLNVNLIAREMPQIYSKTYKENPLIAPGNSELKEFVKNEVMHRLPHPQFKKNLIDYEDIILFSQDSFPIDYLFVPEKYRENTIRFFYYDNNSDYVLNLEPTAIYKRGIVFYTKLSEINISKFKSHRYGANYAFFTPRMGIFSTTNYSE